MVFRGLWVFLLAMALKILFVPEPCTYAAWMITLERKRV